MSGVIRFLTTLIGLIVSGVIAWAGVALWSPHAAHLDALPPVVALLPFERRWWAVALVLLGTAGVAAAFPAPPWAAARPAKRAPIQVEQGPAIEEDSPKSANPA